MVWQFPRHFESSRNKNTKETSKIVCHRCHQLCHQCQPVVQYTNHSVTNTLVISRTHVSMGQLKGWGPGRQALSVVIRLLVPGSTQHWDREKALDWHLSCGMCRLSHLALADGHARYKNNVFVCISACMGKHVVMATHLPIYCNR